MIKLNLGCGQNKLAGYINVDKYDTFAPEVVWDLEKTPWPFDNDSVEQIVMYHVFEHLGADTQTFLSIIQEIYRVSANGAQILITVPHPRSDGYCGDPTHVRPINPAIMSLFSMKMNRDWALKGWANTPLASYLCVDFDLSDYTMNLMPYWLQKRQNGELNDEELNFALNSHFNVINEVSITLTACKPWQP